MTDLNREQLQRLAKLGARARLEELKSEEAAIRHAFPDLFRAGSSRASAAGERSTAPGPQRRRGMSAAARNAASERMKQYWAERRRREA